MSVTVSLESAGDHCFDMPHLLRSGAEDLVGKLLEKAGFNEGVWRVRVNEKQPCSGMTPPISVIRYKQWGIYVRIKPGDNNTCHNVTLILPPGLKTDSTFGRLKLVEKDFNRNWRKEPTVVTTTISNASTALVEIPQVPQIVEVSNTVTDLVVSAVKEKKFDSVAFLKEPDNVKAICLSIHSIKPEDYTDNPLFMILRMIAPPCWNYPNRAPRRCNHAKYHEQRISSESYQR